MENFYERSIKKKNTLTLYNKYNLNNNNNNNSNNDFFIKNQTKEEIKNLKNSLINNQNYKKNTYMLNYQPKLTLQLNNNNNNNQNDKKLKNSTKTIKLLNKKLHKQLSKISEFSSHLNENHSHFFINQKYDLKLNKSSINLTTKINLNNNNKKNTITKKQTFNEINSKINFLNIFSNQNNKKNKIIFSNLKSISSLEHNSSFSIESIKKNKKHSKKLSIRSGSNSINFFNLRQNSVRIDNLIENKKNEDKFDFNLNLKFLEKFSNEKKFEKITNFCYSKKDDFIFKSVIKIDKILTNYEKKNEEILKENYNKNLKNKNIKFFYLKNIKNKIFFNENFINKHFLYFSLKLFKKIKIKQNLNFLSEKIEKYLNINIYDLIIKSFYLNENFYYDEENSITIFNNFSLIKKTLKKKSLRKKNFLRSKAIKSSERNSAKKIVIFFTHFNIKFYNHFMQKDAGIDEFNSIENDKNFIEIFNNKLLSIKKLSFSTINLMKKSSFFNKKTNRKSFSIKKKFSKRKSQSFSDFQILNKNFYNRIRDSLINEEFNRNHLKQLSLKEEINKFKQQKLFISPIKSNNKTFNKILFESNVNIFNKESMMYKTHKLKMQMFKKCKNINDLLFLFIKDGNFQTFKEKFNKFKINPENKDKKGNSYLNLAVQCDCKKIVDFLLSSGADVNTQNNKLNTPLHYALGYQNFFLADMLIKHGADENCKNAEGITPWQSINSQHTINA